MQPQINLNQALLDPTAVFRTPEEILDHDDLPRDQKINLLRCWE